LAVISTTIIILYRPIETKIEIPNVLAIPELSTVGYMKVSVNSAIIDDRGIVFLYTECYELSAYTEPYNAESIFNGLNKNIDARPNTHDLMKDSLDNFGIEVVMVKITELRNSTFVSRLILKQENKIVSLDSKPSDAIALAVRTDSPIYIKEDLMKSEGRNIC
jgi:bifunctional DNase/RNase